MGNKFIRRLFKSNIQRAVQDGLDTVAALKQVMNRVHGERHRSRQETCHLINSLPMVYCDYTF